MRRIIRSLQLVVAINKVDRTATIYQSARRQRFHTRVLSVGIAIHRSFVPSDGCCRVDHSQVELTFVIRRARSWVNLIMAVGVFDSIGWMRGDPSTYTASYL